MFSELLLTLSIRFFLFDFVLFKTVREYLKYTNYIFAKLFSCTYCQGFWCGLIISLCKNWSASIWNHLEFAFAAAIVSFTWTVIVNPFIKKYESDHDLPMI